MQNKTSTLSIISGLKYVDEFISEEEHANLWQAINEESWLFALKRRVQHYGWKYDYKARAIDYSMYLGDLPLWAKLLAERLYSYSYFHKVPDQMIINEYLPGQGIANHVDCEACFGETIASLSLGSTCLMDFIHLETAEKQRMQLEPRSLLFITGEARYNWTHGIRARKTDEFNGIKIKRRLRISMTFRTVVVNTLR